jgi:hypothetical protein
MSWDAAFRKAVEVEAEGSLYFADIPKGKQVGARDDGSEDELGHDESGGFCQPIGLAKFVLQNLTKKCGGNMTKKVETKSPANTTVSSDPKAVIKSNMNIHAKKKEGSTSENKGKQQNDPLCFREGFTTKTKLDIAPVSDSRSSEFSLSSTTAYAPSIALAISMGKSWTTVHRKSRKHSSWLKPKAYAAWVARMRAKKRMMRNLGRLGFGNI